MLGGQRRPDLSREGVCQTGGLPAHIRSWRCCVTLGKTLRASILKQEAWCGGAPSSREVKGE